MPDTTTDVGARAEERLRSGEIAWMTTVRPDGQPQSVPVWFLWDGESFLIYTRPDARKLKNLAANPKVNLSLNSNATDVGLYLEKYRDGTARIGMDPGSFARAYPMAVRATPTRWQVW